jgi:hypothetical protein
MASRNPTPNVSSQYGAPMGRGSNRANQAEPAERFYLRRVRLDSGGYDNGGAYWGTGQPLYYWEGEDSGSSDYIRARGRADAKRQIRENCPEARFFV